MYNLRKISTDFQSWHKRTNKLVNISAIMLEVAERVGGLFAKTTTH